MSQSDYDLSAATNPSAAEFRIAAIEAVEALVTCNSGATAPTETFPNMLFKAAAGRRYRRNNADTAWEDDFNPFLATVASHATTADIWAAAGDTIDWTGTATTTAFPAAPHAGASRRLICAGACSFTAGANMLINGVASGSTITMAAGDIVDVLAITTTQFKLTVARYNGTAVVSSPSFRNRIINPSGAIYQRTVAATADDTYFADCWYALTQTGTITPSVLTDPEDGFSFGIRLTQSQASAQRFGFAQIIEGKNCKDLRGGSAVLVPRIRISNSQAIRYAILGWTGTEDAVTSDVVNDWTSGTYTAGNFFLGSNLSVIAVGAQTPSANTWTSLAALSGSMGSTFNNVIVTVWTEGTAAQNVTLDFDYVQLEKGTTFTSFDFRPYDKELAACRYYLPAYSSNGTVSLLPCAGVAGDTTNCYSVFKMDIVPRVPPTGLTVSDASHFSVNDGTGSTVCNAVTLQNAQGSGGAVYVRFSVASGLTAKQTYHTLFNSSSGKLLFTGCEL